MVDMYFGKVLVRNSLIQLSKDITEAMEFVRVVERNENKVIAESANKISTFIEQKVKNTNDLIDDLFDQIEVENKRRQNRKRKKEKYYIKDGWTPAFFLDF